MNWKVSRLRVSHETKEQIAIFEWIALQGDLYLDAHHVANEGKRSVVERVTLNRMGFTKGFSDIFIARPNKHYHGLFIELKSPNANGKFRKPTKEQVAFIKRKNYMGYCARVAYGMDEAIRIIKHYLNDGLVKDNSKE